MQKTMMFFSGFLVGTSVSMFVLMFLLGKGSAVVPITFMITGITFVVLVNLYDKRSIL